MKRPRFAVSLVLGAMVALISMDGLPPAERGVAADFSDSSADLLCPADFPHASNAGVFEWFENGGRSRIAAPAAAAPMDTADYVTSLEADEFYITATIEQANFITSLYRTLMDNFAFFGEVVEAPDFNYGAPTFADEFYITATIEQANFITSLYRTLMDNFAFFGEAISEPDFNYGAPTFVVNEPATGNDLREQQNAISCDIALGWRSVPALNWMNECDICPNFCVIANPEGEVKTADNESQAGDLSDMVLEVRDLSTDDSLELNAMEQGIDDTPSYADSDVEAAEESTCPVEESYSAFIATVDGGFAYDVIRRPQSLIPDTYLGDASEAAVEPRAEFEQAPLRPRAPLECAQFDCWIDGPSQRGCPLLEEAESEAVVVTDSEGVADDEDAVAGAPLDVADEWPGCDLHAQRGDFAWYYRQQQLGKANTDDEQGPIPGDIDPEHAARLSGGLSIAASSVAAVLSDISERLEELSQEALCQADRMRRNRSQATKPPARKSTANRSEVIFKEL